MKPRAAPALIVAIAMSSPALAHEFWLQPSAFWTAPSTTIPLTLQVGDGSARERSQIPVRRITRFAAVAPDADVIDLSRRFRTGAASYDAQVEFDRPGVYVLALETDNRARSYLPASEFNEYLRVEGLTPALELRSRTGRMHEGATERYSRCAKALIQVGDPAHASVSLAPVGITLEIVPEVNPYAAPRPAALPVQVIYQGRALAGALVQLVDLDRDVEPLETRVTNSAGRATFTMPAAGSWLLSVVWTQSLPTTDEADFETTFSSLSFGLPGLTAALSPP
jgi:uncharacterized GH25 family protein